MKASVIYPTYVHDLVEGVSKNVHHLRASLNSRGIEAVDASPRVDVGQMNRKSVYFTQGVRAFARVRHALADPSIDVVHYHVSIPGMAAWAALARASTRSKKPMVLHMWNPWFDANDVHIDAGNEAVYHRVFNGSVTTTPFLSAFDHLVVSSDYQRRQLDERGYDDIDVISNGVDLEHYRPAPNETTPYHARRELGLPTDKTLLLYYGHLTPWKGVSILAEALPKALHDNPDAHVVIARTHYGKDENALRRRLHELGVLDRVTFLGICDVPLLLQAVDCGVVPATAAVGTACHPNVVLEYHSAGVPIVASRVGSIPEAVADGESSLLANPGDPDDLGEKLQRMLHDDQLRTRLGQNARARAENVFDWNLVARDYEHTYTRTIDRRGQGGIDRDAARDILRGLSKNNQRARTL